MSAVFTSFRQFLWQIRKDNMLLLVCLAPLLAGGVFRWGIPQLEAKLIAYFGGTGFLTPYYLLFDIFLGIITSYLFCYAAAMVMLEERDNKITGYLSVTPVGKVGYLLSRLGFPTVISVLLSIFVVQFFSLTAMRPEKILVLCLLAAPVGTIIALLIVVFSANKVEGMAIAKFSGLIMLGVALPFFLVDARQYWGALLPTFWIAKAILDFRLGYVLVALFCLALWLLGLTKLFVKRVL